MIQHNSSLYWVLRIDKAAIFLLKKKIFVEKFHFYNSRDEAYTQMIRATQETKEEYCCIRADFEFDFYSLQNSKKIQPLFFKNLYYAITNIAAIFEQEETMKIAEIQIFGSGEGDKNKSNLIDVISLINLKCKIAKY